MWQLSLTLQNNSKKYQRNRNQEKFKLENLFHPSCTLTNNFNINVYSRQTKSRQYEFHAMNFNFIQFHRLDFKQTMIIYKGTGAF